MQTPGDTPPGAFIRAILYSLTVMEDFHGSCHGEGAVYVVCLTEYDTVCTGRSLTFKVDQEEYRQDK